MSGPQLADNNCSASLVQIPQGDFFFFGQFIFYLLRMATLYRQLATQMSLSGAVFLPGLVSSRLIRKKLPEWTMGKVIPLKEALVVNLLALL